MKGMPKSIVAVLIGLVLVAIPSVLVAIYSLYHLLYQPIEYKIELFGPALTRYVCPGDILPVDVNITITHVPSVVSVIDTWWSVDQNRTAIRNDNPLYSIFTEPTVVSTTIQISVPNLPSGNYEYRRASEDDGSPPIVITVPVVIKSDCQ